MNRVFYLFWFLIGHNIFMFFVWITLVLLAIECRVLQGIGLAAAIAAWVVFMFYLMYVLNNNAKATWPPERNEPSRIPTSLSVSTGIELAVGVIFVMLGVMSGEIVFLGLIAVSLSIYIASSFLFLRRKYKKAEHNA